MVGGVATLLDHFMLKNENWQSNMSFGISAGLGTSVGNLVGSYVGSAVGDTIIPTTTMYAGSTLTERIIEIGAGSVSAYYINQMVFKNDYYSENMGAKIGTIALSQFLGTYLIDYFTGSPMNYLVNG
jgi:hypothetical protein